MHLALSSILPTPCRQYCLPLFRSFSWWSYLLFLLWRRAARDRCPCISDRNPASVTEGDFYLKVTEECLRLSRKHNHYFQNLRRACSVEVLVLCWTPKGVHNKRVARDASAWQEIRTAQNICGSVVSYLYNQATQATRRKLHLPKLEAKCMYI